MQTGVRRMRAGQSNYAYANGAVDQLVELRRALQLPGMSVQWGPIADVGFVAEVMQARIALKQRLAQRNPTSSASPSRAWFPRSLRSACKHCAPNNGAAAASMKHVHGARPTHACQ